MPTYPETRRSIYQREILNDNGALSSLARALMQGQNTTYNSDLPIGPGDAKIREAAAFGFQTANCFSPQRTVSSTVTSIEVTRAFIPSSRGPHAVAVAAFWVELGASTSVGAIDVTDEQTGAVTTLPVTYAACGSVLTGAWLSVEVPARALTRLVVTARWTSGSSLTVAGISMYWQPLQTVVTGIDYSQPLQSRLLSQTFAASGGSYPVHALASLASWHNRMLGARPPQIMSSWLADWGRGTGAGWRTNATIGAYRVLVSEGVTQLTVAIFAKANVATGQHIYVHVDGVLQAIVTVGTSYAWNTFTVPISSSTSPATHDLRFESIASGWVVVPSVSIWETQPVPTLPSGDAVPGSFVPNDDDLVAGGRSITSAQLARLIANQAWLTRYRTARLLACDCRYTFEQYYDPTDPYALNGIAWGAKTQAVRRFPMAAQGGPIRFTHTYKSHNLGASGYSDFVVQPASTGWHRLYTDLWGTSYATEFTSVNSIGFQTVPTSQPLLTRRDANWLSQSGGSNVDVEVGARWALGYPTTIQHCGMLIEQAPLNSLAGPR